MTSRFGHDDVQAVQALHVLALADLEALIGQQDDPLSDRDYRQHVGKRVRLVRVNLELSQGEVAVKAGLTRNFVSAVERGAQSLDAWRLRRLAEALGVPLAWLLGLTARAERCRVGSGLGHLHEDRRQSRPARDIDLAALPDERVSS